MTDTAMQIDPRKTRRAKQIQTEIDVAAIDHELQFMGDQLRQLRIQVEVGGNAAVDALEHRFTRLTREIALYKLSGKFGDQSLSLDQIRDDARATADQIDELAAKFLASDNTDGQPSTQLRQHPASGEATVPPLGKLVRPKKVDDFDAARDALKRDLKRAYERIQSFDDRAH